MKNLLKTIISDFHSTKLRAVIERNIRLPVRSGSIITVAGVRRSGKTYLLYDTIRKIMNAGTAKRNILYLNFEDERLTMVADQLDLILRAYQELYPKIVLSDCYFFFDEIQNVNGWEKFLRRIFDTITKNIFVTGSNSKLLSAEIATELRGRSLSYTLYPLCFEEYLRFNKADPDYHGTTQTISILNHFNKFMIYGGFPEITGIEDSLKIRKLQDYFNTIIYRDLIERYSITNPVVLKYFLKKICSQVTKPLSVNKIYNDLKSQGYKVSNNLLYEFSGYIQASFAYVMSAKFDYSEIKRDKSEKKGYSIDNGILTAIDFSFSDNHGKLLENLTALEILKSGKELMYYRGKRECDFIIRNGKALSPLQVAYTLADPDTREREIEGLVSACEYLNVKKGTILTFEEQESLTIGQIKIEVMPAFRYFLDSAVRG